MSQSKSAQVYKECQDTIDVAKTIYASSLVLCVGIRIRGTGRCSIALVWVVSAEKSPRCLNFLVHIHRSSPLQWAPGASRLQGGSISTASSECSSSIRGVWLSESFLAFRVDFQYHLFLAAGYADPAGMTIEKCADYCDSQSVPYRFMGITDGFQCCKSTTKTVGIDYSKTLSVRQFLRVYLRER